MLSMAPRRAETCKFDELITWTDAFRRKLVKLRRRRPTLDGRMSGSSTCISHQRLVSNFTTKLSKIIWQSIHSFALCFAQGGSVGTGPAKTGAINAGARVTMTARIRPSHVARAAAARC